MANLTLTYTIQDDKLLEAIDALSYAKGYRDIIDGTPNPETKQQFIKSWILKKLRGIYKGYMFDKMIKTAKENFVHDDNAIN